MGQLTQGTIFNCASAYRYPDKPVFGLTITARCDVAQEKYRLLNYVPVVRLDDWLLIDGLEILLDIEKKDQASKIKSALLEANLSPGLLLSVSIDEIIKVHFPLDIKDRKLIKLRERFEIIRKDIDELKNSQSSPSGCLAWFSGKRPKLVRSLVKDLFEHKVLGYYFLERLQPDAVVEGYVCLLREVSSLSREVAGELSRGLSQERWVELNHSKSHGNIEFVGDDMSAPFAQISSPTIEHIMQSYATLFSRIGIADPCNDELEIIVSRLQSNMESKQ